MAGVLQRDEPAATGAVDFRVLVELLGIDPGPELRQLEHAILCQSRDLDLDERVDGPHSARTLHRRQSGLKRAAAGPRSLRILERLEREARSRVLERLRSGSRESETLPLCTCGLSASREPGTTGLLWADARGEP